MENSTIDPALAGPAATSDAKTVAVLGTGIMGAAMAANLARAGFEVRAWNRAFAKDTVLIMEEAQAAGLHLALLEAVATQFAAGVAAGHGDLDLAATYLTR